MIIRRAYKKCVGLYRFRKMVRFYSQFIGRGDLCFDVGAHVGERTRVFLALGAKVVCVEPQAICLQALHEAFGHRGDVIIVSQAVGDRDGSAEMALCENAPDISTLSGKWQREGRFSRDHRWTKRQSVSVTTLDSLIARYGVPRFCKIDVEGFEPFVFQGLTQPVDVVSFEFTREFFDDARRCIERLLSIGRASLNCSIGETMRFLFPDWVSPEQLYARLARMDHPLLWGDVYAKLGG